MKLMTVLAVASLAIAGVACSESKSKTDTEVADTVAVEAAPAGTLNLSLPSSISSADSSSGTLNLNIGGGSDEPRLIGADQFKGVDFGDVPEPSVSDDLGDDGAADGDDDLIRLPPT